MGLQDTATNGSSGAQERRTFAIISHPDAGKTTLTEKFLLYSGAIEMAGAVKSRKQAAVRSDWMALERARGISITSSVLGLDYAGVHFNLLDTPGHGDFSEDTYRTLYAADSALMVLDAARGVEERTLKLFEVCRIRGIPVITFVNKLDRPSKEPLELLDEVEEHLGVRTAPVTWPVGDGPDFEGVVDRARELLVRYDRTAHGASIGSETLVPLEEAASENGSRLFERVREEIGLLEVVGASFEREAFLSGELTPVFFGSALANFGVRLLLEAVKELAPPPGPRRDDSGRERDLGAPFSGFVYKVQANMDPRHRDRVAFVRVCSGRFVRGMKLIHEPTGRALNTRHAHQLFADDRSTLEEALPGDVVGLVNSGELGIGDTVYGEEPVRFPPIPGFVPEHFLLARNKNSGKHKQFHKGLRQLSEEGVVKVLNRPETGGQEPILGAVGPLQFEVASYRMEHEFGAPLSVRPAPWTEARKVSREDVAPLAKLRGTQIVRDASGQPFALFESNYRLENAAKELGRELMQSYAARGTFDPADYARRIAAIFSEGRIVGRGRATEEAAERLARGVKWDEGGTPPPSAGNGSAMRAGPVGLLYYDDLDDVVQVAREQGLITHRDDRCSAGAVAIAGAVTLALREGPIERLDYLGRISELTVRVHAPFAESLISLSGWVSLPPEQAVRHISRVGLERKLEEGWQEITPFVMPSVLWSLYSFLRSPEDYWQTIRTAIAVGGDVDTTAAMAGAISGAHLGLGTIPRKLARRLTDRGAWGLSELVNLAEKCYEIKHRPPT